MNNTNNILNLLLQNSKGVSFATVVTSTNPVRPSAKAQRELAEMFPGHTAIIKLGRRQVSIGNNYTTAVNNRLDKSDLPSTFEVDKQSRDWSERLTTGLIRHKETFQMYLEYYYLSKNKSEYSYVWEDGTELTSEELAKAQVLFVKASSSKKQEEAGLTEEEQVKVNLVKIENVISIKAFGQEVHA